MVLVYYRVRVVSPQAMEHVPHQDVYGEFIKIITMPMEPIFLVILAL